MASDGQLSDAALGELAAFADGSLACAERARIAARVERSPELQALVADQRAAIAAVERLDVRAPAALQVRLETAPVAAIDPAPVPARRRLRLPRPALARGLAAALAATALALILFAGSGQPTVAETAALADRGAAAPAPALDATDPSLLATSVAGVAFPNYEPSFGWRAAGERADRLDGRETKTVYYRQDGRELAYSIVSGAPLAWPEGASRTTREGIELRSFADDGSTVVTWRRGGHTCVLSGDDGERAELLELAAWMGEGSVAF